MAPEPRDRFFVSVDTPKRNDKMVMFSQEIYSSSLYKLIAVVTVLYASQKEGSVLRYVDPIHPDPLLFLLIQILNSP